MSRRVLLASAAELPSAGVKVFNVEGISIVAARVDGRPCAVLNKCPHVGLPLAGGKREGNTIICPWHGSRFDLCSGENLDWVQGVAGIKLPAWSRQIIALGKKPAPVQSFPVIEEDGKLYVELPS
ncbi:MAG: Rieske (2Fe-2S) protein [Anaerolineae bacterium]|nr:Rieske (2Fe-2S) protein [Thermoflexales bacterium]MDW8396196.1 Rieske (2Fe-2S) protein [Anaerolineae bacterium]